MRYVAQHYPNAAKTITYSLMHLTVAMIVAYLLTGSWAIALGIGLIEPLVQTAAYHLHERVWQGYQHRPQHEEHAA